MLFLCRKLPAVLPPPLLLAGPPARASAAAMDHWLAFYHTSIAAAAAADEVKNPAIDPSSSSETDCAPASCHASMLASAAESRTGSIPGGAADPGPGFAGVGVETTTHGRLWLHGGARSSPGLVGFLRTARLEAGGDHLRCVFDATGVAGPAAASAEQASSAHSQGNSTSSRTAVSCPSPCGQPAARFSPGAGPASSARGAYHAGEQQAPVSAVAEVDSLEAGADAAHGQAGAAEMVAAAVELDLVCNVFVGGVHGCFASADLLVCGAKCTADGCNDSAPSVNPKPIASFVQGQHTAVPAPVTSLLVLKHICSESVITIIIIACSAT